MLNKDKTSEERGLKGDSTSRRSFIGKTSIAGACLFMQGLGLVAMPALRSEHRLLGLEPNDKALGDESPGSSVNSPIILVTQLISPSVNPRAATWTYITEILGRAGLFFEQMVPSQLASLVSRTNSIIVLAGDFKLTSEQQKIVTAMVENGASLIGIGGTSGLDKVFGIDGKHPLAEGWINVTAEDHPVTRGLRSSLHVFGGYAVTSGTASSLADLESGRQGAKGSSIVENQFGKGQAMLLAIDKVNLFLTLTAGIKNDD